MPNHKYIFAPTRELWPATSVNARLPAVRMDDGTKIAASTWLDKNQPVEQMTWAPGQPSLITNRLIAEGGWVQRDGCTVFNLYRPPIIIPGKASEAQRWLD
jgi:hypothetical protein